MVSAAHPDGQNIGPADLIAFPHRHIHVGGIIDCRTPAKSQAIGDEVPLHLAFSGKCEAEVAAILSDE